MSEKQYRILFSSISGQMVGGGQRSLLLLLEGLDRNRYKPFLICPDNGDLSKSANDLGLETWHIPMPSLKALKISVILKVIKIVRENRIDLIHADSPRQAFYLGIAALLTGKPMLWHVRVGYSQNPLFDYLLYLLSKRVITVSKAAADRFRYVPGKKKKIVIIHNAVDPERFGPHIDGGQIRKALGLQNSIVVGTAGQILPKKGQDLFIRAAAKVTKRCNNSVRFLVVGEGERPFVDSLKREAEGLGIADLVTFTGFRKEMPQIMRAIDIFVLVSTYKEGLSRVIIEAMATGIPVIAFCVGGNIEVINSGINGYIVPTKSIDGVADAIVELVTDTRKRMEMGRNAREHIVKHFNLKTQVEKIQSIYKETLCRNM